MSKSTFVRPPCRAELRYRQALRLRGSQCWLIQYIGRVVEHRNQLMKTLRMHELPLPGNRQANFSVRQMAALSRKRTRSLWAESWLSLQMRTCKSISARQTFASFVVIFGQPSATRRTRRKLSQLEISTNATMFVWALFLTADESPLWTCRGIVSLL